VGALSGMCEARGSTLRLLSCLYNLPYKVLLKPKSGPALAQGRSVSELPMAGECG
jgi:hypothetical protein